MVKLWYFLVGFAQKYFPEFWGQSPLLPHPVSYTYAPRSHAGEQRGLTQSLKLPDRGPPINV